MFFEEIGLDKYPPLCYDEENTAKRGKTNVKYLKFRRSGALRATAMLLLLSVLMVYAVSCAPTGAPQDTTDAQSTVQDETTVTDETTAAEETTAMDGTTAAEETTEALPPEKQDYVVSPAWHLGYVGSASNASFKEKLNTNGTMYFRWRSV